jgi:hypothetical protein
VLDPDGHRVEAVCHASQTPNTRGQFLGQQQI